jgi:maleamate amidohydrolase
VLDAMPLGFRRFIVANYVGDCAIDPHEASLFDMAQTYGEVMSLNDLLARLPVHRTECA